MSAAKDFLTTRQMNAAPSRLEKDADLPARVFSLEPFVDAETVASFLSIPRAEVLRLTREDKIRGYAYKGRLRHVYRYRLSEVSEDFAALTGRSEGTIPKSALASQRRKSNG